MKVTSMFPGNTNPSVGNSTGTLIASQGTGAFTNAVLTIDFLTMPYPSVTTGPTQAMLLWHTLTGQRNWDTNILPCSTNS